MDIDPKVLKELHQTFSAELEEQAQVIVDSLLLIENKNKQKTAEEEMKTAVSTMLGRRIPLRALPEV